MAVNVYEDLSLAYFVDADTGDDTTGTGSRENPFASLSKAIEALSTSQEDIYIKTRNTGGIYDETSTTLGIPAGTSLYGGYDNNWIRNVKTNKTLINTNHRGIQYFDVTQPAWFSGFNLMTMDSPDAEDDVIGVHASGDNSAAFHMHDNIVTNGNVETGEVNGPGINYGVELRFLAVVNLRNNEIITGSAGNGISPNTGTKGNNGDEGDNGNRNGGHRAAGGNTGFGGTGGLGGTRGGGINGNGGNGDHGANRSAPLGGVVSGGIRGTGGTGNIADAGSHGNSGNTGGRGRPGAAGSGHGNIHNTLRSFITAAGSTGTRGGHGSGGGGGGGGEANNFGVIGGGGGGGGQGGNGGNGAFGGAGGGASIGIWLHSITTSELIENTITSNAGGFGGRGGVGGSGGSGGVGGSFANGDSNVFGSGGRGGFGGMGGVGGRGGYGGSGGGGPSYGIIFSAGMEPLLSGNTITSGNAGNGGRGWNHGNGGEGGYSFAVYDRDPNDAFFAMLNGNTNILTAGAPGTGGSGGGQSGAMAGSDGLSGLTNWNK